MNFNLSEIKGKTITALAVIGGLAVIKTVVSVVKKVRSKSVCTDEDDTEPAKAKAAPRPLFEHNANIQSNRNRYRPCGDANMATDCCDSSDRVQD